jgi:hypothetical protein
MESLSWELIGSVPYRKFSVMQPRWPLDPAQYTFVTSPNPVAPILAIRNTSKLTKLSNSTLFQPQNSENDDGSPAFDTSFLAGSSPFDIIGLSASGQPLFVLRTPTSGGSTRLQGARVVSSLSSPSGFIIVAIYSSGMIATYDIAGGVRVCRPTATHMLSLSEVDSALVADVHFGTETGSVTPVILQVVSAGAGVGGGADGGGGGADGAAGGANSRISFLSVLGLSGPSVNPYTVPLANADLTTPPSAALALSETSVLVSVEATLLTIDETSIQDKLLQTGPFSRLARSGDLVSALSAADGTLFVYRMPDWDVVSSFATKSRVPPLQMAWVGADACALFWDKLLFIVGPQGNWIKYSYEGPVRLQSTADGMFVLSASDVEYLQRVPEPLERVFAVGSTAPAAILYDAAEHFANELPKADELVRAIKSTLASAVDDCCAAAATSTDLETQQSLLRAASFGRAFLDYYDADRLVTTAASIRVLNQLRVPSIGIHLTLHGLESLGAEDLLGALCARRQHFAALQVAKVLKTRPDAVLVDWAIAKVRSTVAGEAAGGGGAGGRVPTEVEVASVILDRLSTSPGVSFAEVAAAAAKLKKPALAAALLDHEPRAADQVPLLLSLGRPGLALSKAVGAGDTDLIYLVVLHVMQKRPFGELVQLLATERPALDLLQVYLGDADRRRLRQLHVATGRGGEAAYVVFDDAYRSADLTLRLRHLSTAASMFADSPDSAESAHAAASAQKLLQLQKDLLSLSPATAPPLGVSLADTLASLFLAGQPDKAAAVARDFGVGEARLAWTALRAHREAADASGFTSLVSSLPRKPAIGFAPYARAASSLGLSPLAASLASKISDHPTKLSLSLSLSGLLLRLLSWREGIEREHCCCVRE